MTSKPSQDDLMASHSRETHAGRVVFGPFDPAGSWTCGKCGKQIPRQVYDDDDVLLAGFETLKPRVTRQPAGVRFKRPRDELPEPHGDRHAVRGGGGTGSRKRSLCDRLVWVVDGPFAPGDGGLALEILDFTMFDGTSPSMSAAICCAATVQHGPLYPARSEPSAC
jgi:hypothetical protein